jgi:hypothetical protein
MPFITNAEYPYKDYRKSASSAKIHDVKSGNKL